MLDGKIALVTGASRGIGREIALTLARQGAFVIINYSGNEEAANTVLEEVKSQGGQGEIYQCSVENFEDVKSMITYIIKEHKTLDIIVNNAGITKDNLLLKMKEEDFDRVIAINLKGAFNVVKHSIRYMLKQKSGKIVNISSLVGITGNTGQINYSASKAGIIGLTKSLAQEVASKGITVNAVAPGFIETDMTSVLSDELREEMTAFIPMKKTGTPEDVANAVAFFVSDSANYITGQILEVNGGMNM